MKALVLSSGGVDSTTCVALAVEKHGAENVSTITAYYGQKHENEIESARKIALLYSLAHYEIDLCEVMSFSDCSLLKTSNFGIRHECYAEQISKYGKVDTYVPFRNGVLLSCCAAIASSIYPDEEVEIYIGAHADDSAGNAYPDCSARFMKSIGDAVLHGTYDKVRICAPLVNMTKSDVVRLGISIDAPYHLTWSCYEGGEIPCGKCATCIDRAKAFEDNGIKDPAR